MNKAEVAKLKVELRAAEKGWTVSRTAEGARYDLVLDDGKRLYRVQVKYAGAACSHSQGCVYVMLRRSETRTYNTSEVDAVVVYVPQDDALCWLPPEKFDGKGSLVLRYGKAANGQKNRVNHILDFVW